MLDWNIHIVKWEIINKSLITTPKGKKLVEMILEDKLGNKAYLHFLNSTYALREVKKGQVYLVIGKPKLEYWKITFWHPELVLSETSNSNWQAGNIYPIYSQLWPIKPSWFARKIWENLDQIPKFFEEIFPKEFLKEFDLITKVEMVKNMHYPTDFTILKKAKYRLWFEKLLFLQLVSLLGKQDYISKTLTQTQGHPDRGLVREFLSHLPFELTKAQKKAIKQIVDDFHAGKPAMRLLQWDVGSGKTVVAATLAWYVVKKFNWQVAFLAPTEVLAKQHLSSLAKLFLPLGIKIKLLVGSLTPKEKKTIKKEIELGYVDLIVGTHALIQEDVKFKNLKLAVIDEQHKFGVKQRAFLKAQGSPHIVQMSATPIPRSLALAFFGEFDVSVIDQMPHWRKPVITKIITQEELIKMKPWFENKLQQGEQIFVVTPLIEESEFLDEVSSATQEFESMKKFFDRRRVWLLHGKMKSKEKEKVMKQFKDGELQILVSTTVIEVGVDVPQATIMIIKNAERFGLAQLHQLRWRVGRSDKQSYAFLLTKSKGGDTYKRLKALEKTTDGFKLAELDMEFRWTGEILGVRQAWVSDLPPSVLSDVKLLEKVQQWARWLLSKYENLNWLDKLKEQLKKLDKDILV